MKLSKEQKLNQEILEMYENANPLSEKELRDFGEKNQEILERIEKEELTENGNALDS